MKYPSGADYAEALQNTAACFRDPELAGGTVQSTPLGMPRAISGNFASVFCIASPRGKRYAIKCFTRHILDQQDRYVAVSTALADLDRPWQVAFDYQEFGIFVQGRWYPLLKMEWIEAQGLLPWLEEHLHDAEAIADVTAEFGAAVSDLQSAGLAHGDLQHGNLLVDRAGRLRVIDYDGMFVQSLVNRGAAEMGHLNYQSPLRTMDDFDHTLDRFAAWLIYVSLLLLVDDPGLWIQFHDEGEEKLLFGRDDFVDQEVLEALSGPPEFDPALESLRSCWDASDLTQVPPFDPAALPTPSEMLSGDFAVSSTPAAASRAPRRTRSAEPLPPVRNLEFCGGLLLSRTALTLAVLGLLGLPLAVFLPAVGAAVAVVGLLTAVLIAVPAYRAQPENDDRESAAAELAARQRDREVAEDRLAEVQQGERAGGARGPGRTVVPSPLAASPSQQRLETDRLSELEAERARAHDALQELQSTEAVRLRDALSRRQETHVQALLKANEIERAILLGVNRTLARQLGSRGVFTAADLTSVEVIEGGGRAARGQTMVVLRNGRRVKIDGFTAANGESLRSWYLGELAKAQASAPIALSTAETAAIRKGIEVERRELKAAQARLMKRISQENRMAKHRSQNGQLRARQNDSKNAAAAARRMVLGAQDDLEEATWAEQVAARRLESYSSLTLVRFLLR